MSVHIKFDSEHLSLEEASGLAAFLGAVTPSLFPAKVLRAREDARYGHVFGHAGSAGSVADQQPAGTLPEGYQPPAEVANAVNVIPSVVEPPPTKRGRKPKEEQVKAETADAAQVAALGEAKPNISTAPEDRVDPAEAAQDAADEQAEVEANRDAEKPLTTDDVKAAMMLYVNKFTMVAAQEDGPKIYAEALGAPPNGEAGWRLSLVGGLSQDKIAKARDAWLSAANGEKRWGQ